MGMTAVPLIDGRLGDCQAGRACGLRRLDKWVVVLPRGSAFPRCDGRAVVQLEPEEAEVELVARAAVLSPRWLFLPKLFWPRDSLGEVVGPRGETPKPSEGCTAPRKSRPAAQSASLER